MRKDEATPEEWDAYKQKCLAWYHAHKGTVSEQRKITYLRDVKTVKTRVKRYQDSLNGQGMINARQRRIKAAAMERIGGAFCVRCGCADIRALEINHKYGGGTKERRTTNKYGIHMWNAILSGKRSTDDLNVLCRVCNNLDYMERKFPELKGLWKVMWAGQRRISSRANRARMLS